MKSFKKLIVSFVLPYLASTSKIYSCKEDKTIALTFDDGPFKYTKELIDLLNANGIKATFFINAENYWKDLPTSNDKQAVIKKAYESGHQIASHTWAHNIPSDINQFDAMMHKMDSWIESIIGHKPAYFRAPKGECNSNCINYLEEKNYKLIQWDTDTNDWDKSSGVDYRVKKAKEFLSENFNYERSNYLVLMHDVYEHTVRQIVPWIISHKPNGYRFVTVAECLGDKSSMYRSSNVEKVEETKATTTTTTTTTTPTTTITTISTTTKSKTTTSVVVTTSAVTTTVTTDTVTEPTNISSSTRENDNDDSSIITDDSNGSNMNYEKDKDTINNETDNNQLTNNDNLDSFYDNTVINDDNQGNLNYESSSTSIYRSYNCLLLFSFIFIILKLIYL